MAGVGDYFTWKSGLVPPGPALVNKCKVTVFTIVQVITPCATSSFRRAFRSVFAWGRPGSNSCGTHWSIWILKSLTISRPEAWHQERATMAKSSFIVHTARLPALSGTRSPRLRLTSSALANSSQPRYKCHGGHWGGKKSGKVNVLNSDLSKPRSKWPTTRPSWPLSLSEGSSVAGATSSSNDLKGGCSGPAHGCQRHSGAEVLPP